MPTITSTTNPADPLDDAARRLDGEVGNVQAMLRAAGPTVELAGRGIHDAVAALDKASRAARAAHDPALLGPTGELRHLAEDVRRVEAQNRRETARRDLQTAVTVAADMPGAVEDALHEELRPRVRRGDFGLREPDPVERQLARQTVEQALHGVDGPETVLAAGRLVRELGPGSVEAAELASLWGRSFIKARGGDERTLQAVLRRVVGETGTDRQRGAWRAMQQLGRVRDLVEAASATALQRSGLQVSVAVMPGGHRSARVQ